MVPRLGFGQFYGSRGLERCEAGLSFALMRPDPVREVALHTHDTAHVIIHLEGTYLSSAAGAPRMASAPVVVINPPGTTHRDRNQRVSGEFCGRFLSIAVGAEWWREIMGGVAAPADATGHTDSATLALAGRLVGALGQAPGSALEALALELMVVHATGLSPAPTNVPSWLARAREVLEDGYALPLRVTDVARACNVHPVYLARVFRQYLGMSPAGFLRDVRVRRAAALLACTSREISDIALACGFSHQSHLTTLFRRVLGVTPGEYRKGRSGLRGTDV